jgi:hypothetical protein
MKRTILFIFVAALAGCANLKFQWAASYQTDNLAGELAQSRTTSASTSDESAK